MASTESAASMKSTARLQWPSLVASSAIAPSTAPEAVNV